MNNVADCAIRLIPLLRNQRLRTIGLHPLGDYCLLSPNVLAELKSLLPHTLPGCIIPTTERMPHPAPEVIAIKDTGPLTSTDTTFITNEAGQRLVDRFRVLIKDTRFFDVLVGYFYTSDFYAICQSLEAAEKIRILIGIKTNRQTLDLIEQSKSPCQMSLQYSHSEANEWVFWRLKKQEFRSRASGRSSGKRPQERE